MNRDYVSPEQYPAALAAWQRSQAVNHYVYLVWCAVDYEGSCVMSVHNTKASAEAACAKAIVEHKHCDKHGIDTMEVQP